MVVLRIDELVLAFKEYRQREEFVLKVYHYSPTIYPQYS